MDLIERIRQCKRCVDISPNPQVFGDIIKSKIVFISEEPTKIASEKNFFEYYLGKRRFHDLWMPEMGITIDWLQKYPYITHIYKCYSAKKNKCDICKEWLELEKGYFKNKVIITFGEVALSNLLKPPYPKNSFKKYILGFKDFIKIEEMNTKVLPIIHPSWHNNDFIETNDERIKWILEKIRMHINKI